MVEMKGIGLEPIYAVSNLKGRQRTTPDKSLVKNLDGKANTTSNNNVETNTITNSNTENKQAESKITNQNLGLVNESDS